jgi:hypothetical protein
MSVSPSPARRTLTPGITSGLSDVIRSSSAFAQLTEQNRLFAKSVIGPPAYTPPAFAQASELTRRLSDTFGTSSAFAQLTEQNRLFAKSVIGPPAYTPPAFAQASELTRRLSDTFGTSSAFAQLTEQNRLFAKSVVASPAFTRMTEQLRLSLVKSPSLVKLIERSQRSSSESNIDPVEVAVHGETLTLAPIPELLNSLCEAGNSEDFADFANLLESDPEWDAALEHTLAQVRISLLARPAVKRAIVWGVYLSVAGILWVAMAKVPPVGYPLAALGGISARDSKKWVEDKLDEKWPTPTPGRPSEADGT